MLAVGTVHTTGVNWESVITIVGSLVAIFSVVLTMMHYYSEKREERTRESYNELRADFKESIDHLGDVLSARLETKDRVSALSERVATLEGKEK